MNKEEIIFQLKTEYASFADFIGSLDEKGFLYSTHNKWTPGEHAAHLLRSVKPVSLAFSFPKFILALIFGKSNRPSKTYEALVEKYKTRLAAGGKALGRFVPPPVEFLQQKQICAGITSTINSLGKKIQRLPEQDLDQYILPHPLLGKLTLREMLYFTIHHASHHLNGVKNLLNTRVPPA